MKIIHIVENLDSRYGGPAKSVPLLVKYLSALGVENKIIINFIEKVNNKLFND